MGRWLDALKDTAKFSEDAPRRTDKTDKTPSASVSSVLSVGLGDPRENFRDQNVAGERGFVSSVSAVPDVHKKFTLAGPDTKFSTDAGNPTDNTDKTLGTNNLFTEALARIIAVGCPEAIPDQRWHLFKADAAVFLSTWGEQAARLGWEVSDVFGLHPVAGLNRHDTTGLVWMLKGRQHVVALTATETRLSGGLAFYRPARATNATCKDQPDE